MNRNNTTRISRGRGYYPGTYRQGHRYQQLTDASIESSNTKIESENQESADDASRPNSNHLSCPFEPPADKKSDNVMSSQQGEIFFNSRCF